MHRIEPFRVIPLEQAGESVAWARGCDKCKFGLINPPPANVAAPLYIARTTQAALGLLTFCDCRAGKTYRQSLIGTYRSMSDGADSKTPAFRDKVVAEVRAQAAPAPVEQSAMSQAEIDAALADLDEVHVPTVGGVAYA